MVLEKWFIDQYVEAIQHEYMHIIMPALAKREYKKAQTLLEDYISTFTRDADALFDELPLGNMFLAHLGILYRNTRSAAAGELETEERVRELTANVSQLFLRMSNQRKIA